MATPDMPDPALRRLVDQVNDARSRRSPLHIRGGGTKPFGAAPAGGEALDLIPLAGISSHEPSELVVTVRAGTPLLELEAALAEHGQCLPFEPPRFDAPTDAATAAGPRDGVMPESHAAAAGGTVGGMVAAGLAGPSRVAAGSVRDHLLGATLLNGRGEVLGFGGQVMKNVAGYDLCRVLAGSMGVLGVILEVSLKVLPRPPALTTLSFDLGQEQALALLTGWRRLPLPLHASSWHDGQLRLRLAGARAAVLAAAERLGSTHGGRALDANEAAAWWQAVRDQRLPFFRTTAAEAADGLALWRLSLPPATPVLALPGPVFVEWGGAQRWLRSPAPAAQVQALAAAAGGHASCVRPAAAAADAFAAPLPEVLMRVHRGLKQAFDPERIFNPGRLYADL
jgi:FAD/FMN-containing dehydrogenase